MRRGAYAIEAEGRRRARARRLALIAGLLFLSSPPAGLAAPHKSASNRPAAPATAQADDGLGPHDVYLEADDLIDDRQTFLVTAEGHVEVRYQGRTLRADKVIYNRVNGATHAFGHVVMMTADGMVTYAGEAELDDQFRAGLELGFSARLQDNVTIVANSAVHRNEMVNTFRQGRVTPCNICNADGSPSEPTFSIEAQTIVEDRNQEVIYYRHAVIRVKGVPILKLPFFWHADPTAARVSGFLTPKVEYSKRRGLSYEQPYLFALTPYSELIVDPQFNTSVNPELNLRYREQFYSGLLDIRTGFTHDQLFDSHGDKFGADTDRSYILAKGAWDIDPRFTVGFGAEQVTDPTFFERYGVRQLFQDRGPFLTDTDRLITQLYATRQDSQSYVSVAAIDYQSIRDTVDNELIQSYDTSSAFPVVGPLVEARYDPTSRFFGGQLRLLVSAVALSRNNPVISVSDPTGLNPQGPQPFVPTVVPATSTTAQQVYQPARPTNAPSLTYTDSRRLTTEGDWRTDITLDDGMRFSPFLQARGDLYSIDNGVLASGPNYTDLEPSKSVIPRGTGTIGMDASWPFFRPLGAGSVILEPLIELAASPKAHLNPSIPNEDSASFEFDESTLFTINRFPGYDLYEGGARADIGGRATFDFGGGRGASILVGRVYRTEPDMVFTATSGLQGTASDWVSAITITPLPGLSFFNRERNDSDTWKVHEEEAGVNLSIGRATLSMRYQYNENGVLQVQCATTTCLSPFGGMVINGTTVIGRTQSAELSGTTYLTKHWGVFANITRDLETRIFPVAQLGVFYQDECVRLDILYTHDETYSSVIGTSDAVTFRLTLATLGANLGPGSKPYDGR